MKEVQETVKKALKRNQRMQETKLEINASRFAYDSTFIECCEGVLSGLFKAIEAQVLAFEQTESSFKFFIFLKFTHYN